MPDVGSVAVNVVVPGAIVVTRPWDPGALSIVAAAVCDELQVTVVVRSCVVLSLNVPVAANDSW